MHLFRSLQITTWLKIGLLLVIWKLAVFAAMYLGQRVLPLQTAFSSYQEAGVSAPYFLHQMSNFDGQHYLAIAEVGYEHLTQAFFPIYPFTIGLLHRLTGLPYLISGVIISHFSFAIGLFFVWQLLKLDGKTSAIWLCSIIIIFFPTAQFYGAIYNDALFFCLATATLYFGRSKHWLLAGLVGGLATLTRLNGLALWFFLCAEYCAPLFAEKKWQLQRQLLFTLFIPLAFLAYLLYQQITFGSWQVVFSNMQVWHQEKVTLPLIVIWRYLRIFVSVSPRLYQYWVALFEFGSVAVYVFCLLYGWRKIRFSYWLFLAFSILIPWLTGSFQGMPRYGLHLYPLFLILTIFLQSAPKWLKYLYFVICSLLFIFYTAFFAQGYFVA